MANEEWRDRVVNIAKTWLRTPYHHHARVKGHGVDCAMILIEVYAEAGLVNNFDVGYYSEQWHLHHSEEIYLKWIDKYCQPIPYDKPKPGDIAMFRFGRATSHGAIVVDWPIVINAYVGLGVTYADAFRLPLTDQMGRSRFQGAYTI